MGLVALSCKKAKNTSITSHTSKMVGARLWHQYVHDVRYGYYDTSYYLPDTSFAAITVINDKTIQFGNVVLSYVDSLSNDSMLDFYYQSAATSTMSNTA